MKISGLSKSTYYYEITKKTYAEKNEELIRKIEKIFAENKERYGVRRVYHELKNQGCECNHKKVQKIMNMLSLKGKQPREKYRSYKGEVGKVADNVIKRNFSAGSPNEKWTTDVTQFNLPFGKCYLSPILDMYNNEIIAYILSMHPDFQQTMTMLNKALAKHPNVKGLILHSDQGWQYQMKQYSDKLKEYGIIQSMSRKGNCLDNSVMETFFGRLKNEMFYGYEKNIQPLKISQRR